MKDTREVGAFFSNRRSRHAQILKTLPETVGFFLFINMMNLFKTKQAKRRDAKKQFENQNLPLWKRIVALLKIAFTAVGKQD